MRSAAGDTGFLDGAAAAVDTFLASAVKNFEIISKITLGAITADIVAGQDTASKSGAAVFDSEVEYVLNSGVEFSNIGC